MDKIVKEEVITLYVSQVAMLLVCLVCTLLPLYMHPVMMTGGTAVIGLVLFCVVLALNISIVNEKLADWFMQPAMISYSAFRSVLDKMEHKARLGTLAQEDYDNWWNRGLSTFDWFARLSHYFPFVLFDYFAVIVSFSVVVGTQIMNQRIVFCPFYGIAGFFVIVQLLGLFISVRFLRKSAESWGKRLEQRFAEFDNSLKLSKFSATYEDKWVTLAAKKNSMLCSRIYRPSVNTSPVLFFIVNAVGIIFMIVVPLPTIVFELLFASLLFLSFCAFLSQFVDRKSRISYGLVLSLSVFPSIAGVGLTRSLVTGNLLNNSFSVLSFLATKLFSDRWWAGIISVLLLFTSVHFLFKSILYLVEISSRILYDNYNNVMFDIQNLMMSGTITEDEWMNRKKKVSSEIEYRATIVELEKLMCMSGQAVLLISILNMVGVLFYGVFMNKIQLMEVLGMYMPYVCINSIVSILPQIIMEFVIGMNGTNIYVFGLFSYFIKRRKNNILDYIAFDF